MNIQDDSVSSADSGAEKQQYSAPAVVSAVKVTDVVRGGSGFQSDGNNFRPL